jgi:hypothetical protein
VAFASSDTSFLRSTDVETEQTAKAMKNAWFGWIVLCALVTTSGCRGRSTDWNGTWNLNRSESNFHGPVFTLSIPKAGEYRYDDGRSSFTLRCDGKYRPIGKNRTQSCVRSSPSTLDVTRKENGVKTNASHWELSAGGGVSMRFYCADASCHAYVDSKIESDSLPGKPVQSVTFFLPIEAAAVDSFVSELRLLGVQKTGVARLAGVPTPVDA